MEKALGGSVGVSATWGEITTTVGHASEDSSGHLNSCEHRDRNQACSLLVRLSRGPTSLRDHRCVRAHRAARAPRGLEGPGPDRPALWEETEAQRPASSRARQGRGLHSFCVTKSHFLLIILLWIFPFLRP